MDELVKLGIDGARMSARGYGERHPVADNYTEAGRQKNRRISLRVTDKQVSLVSAAARLPVEQAVEMPREAWRRRRKPPGRRRSAPPP